MLTTRPTKRAGKDALFGAGMLFDVLREGSQVGTVVYDKHALRGALAVDGRKYTVERLTDQPPESTTRALIRMMSGGERPPANPWALKDESGQALALAERTGEKFVVSRGDEGFSFRKVKRPYHLYREGSEQSLGSVGQKGFFSTGLHMDLPAEFDSPFQLFLLVLLLNLTMENMEALSRSR